MPLVQATSEWRQAMSDPKQQQQAEEEQIADLTVPDAQAEEVGGGGENVSFNYGTVKVTYTPQKP
jgi:hypothetical protein